MVSLSRQEINEEIDFFRDICGWSDRRIEERLGLSEGTLAQRKHREARKENVRGRIDEEEE